MPVERSEIELTATDRTGAAFASVRRNLSSMAKLIAGAFVTREILRFSNDVIDAGDQLAKMSSKIGASVESLSSFSYGAKLAGTDIETLERSMFRLASTVQDAVNDPLNDQARLFREIGVNIADSSGQIRSIDAIMEDVGDRFAATADDAEKTIVAVKLFGKSGADLIPFLNTMRQTGDEARRTGNIISTEFAKSAENFNDSITRLQEGSQRLARAVLGEIVPALDELLQRFNVAVGAQARLSLNLLEKDRATLVQRFQELQQRIQTFGFIEPFVEAEKTKILASIDAIDALIIEENKRLKSLSGAGAAKPSLGINTESSEELKRILAELQKATEQANLAILTDDRERAMKSLEIDRIAMRSKVDLVKVSSKERQQVENAYLEWLKARETQAFREARTPFQTLLDNWTDTTTQMRDKTAEWAQDAADKLTEFVMTGKLNFKDFAKSIISDLIRIRIQQQLVGLFNSAGRGNAFNSILSALGFRAEGGPVTAGRPYIVGERGPELFTPAASGFITPNAGGGGLVQNITIDARGADRGVELRIRQAMLIAKEQAKSELIRDVQAGGNVARVFGR